jgi:hypothetical protein
MGVISNPLGAQGTPAKWNNWQQVIPMRAAGAIATGRVVFFTMSTGRLTATQAATGSDTDLCRGISQSVATAAGETVMVCVAGVAYQVAAEGTINAGDTVGRSGTTAGSVAAVATPNAGAAIGVCITTAASNLCDVWVNL